MASIGHTKLELGAETGVARGVRTHFNCGLLSADKLRGATGEPEGRHTQSNNKDISLKIHRQTYLAQQLRESIARDTGLEQWRSEFPVSALKSPAVSRRAMKLGLGAWTVRSAWTRNWRSGRLSVRRDLGDRRGLPAPGRRPRPVYENRLSARRSEPLALCFGWREQSPALLERLLPKSRPVCDPLSAEPLPTRSRRRNRGGRA
jgi:hypothetical protein